MATVHNMQVVYDRMAEASRRVRDQVAEEGAHVLREVSLEMGPGVARCLARASRSR
jgi:hypothetical protein